MFVTKASKFLSPASSLSLTWWFYTMRWQSNTAKNFTLCVKILIWISVIKLLNFFFFEICLSPNWDCKSQFTRDKQILKTCQKLQVFWQIVCDNYENRLLIGNTKLAFSFVCILSSRTPRFSILELNVYIMCVHWLLFTDLYLWLSILFLHWFNFFEMLSISISISHLNYWLFFQ